MLEMRTGKDDNSTPLARAAWKGKPKVAAKLIELGADVEAKDHNWGNTPLRWCCWWGTHQVVPILLEARAEFAGASRMAQGAKTGNQMAKGREDDYDKVSQIIDEYEAELAKQ